MTIKDKARAMLDLRTLDNFYSAVDDIILRNPSMDTVSAQGVVAVRQWARWCYKLDAISAASDPLVVLVAEMVNRVARESTDPPQCSKSP